jgi:bla regulator protein BlaR1
MISLLGSHLWQSTLFAGAAALLTLAFRGNKAHVRYCLWLTASYKFLVPFALLTGLGSHLQMWTPASVHQIAIAAPQFSYTVDRFSQPLFHQNPLPANAASTRAWMDLVIPGLWLCGVVNLALTRLRRWRAIRLLVRASIPANIAAPIEIRSSPGLVEPGVVGLMRPVLLLPQGIAQRLTPAEMNAILAHELCHVRRRDNPLACLHMIVETIFWFHPLVWWIGARLLDERERACDEEVVNRGNPPGIYAEAILKVCKLYVESPLVCVSGVTGSDLKRRIESIMRNRRVAGLSLAKKFALGIAGMLALIVPVVIGALNAVWAQEVPDWQTKAGGKMAFEVASVKLDKGYFVPPDFPLSAGDAYRPTGGLFRASFPLSVYIEFAYKVWPDEGQRRQLSQLPKWVSTDSYRIEARAATGSPTKDQMRLMMQSLLADRFQLASHFETREVPVFALTLVRAGKPGPKLIAHADDPPCGNPGEAPGPGLRGFPPDCGSLVLNNRSGSMLLGSRNITMDVLANSLSVAPLELGRPVIDKTGLKGSFDFTLQWTAETAGPAASEPVGPPPETGGPSPLQALRDQLGLKLESARGPVQILVVDRVERPSEN